MMDYSIHARIKRLLEETNDAYGLCASTHMNADFAEFASMSLSDFKRALRDPDLTARRLRRMLRDGCERHKSLAPKSCWSTFMAAYVSSEVSNDASRAAAA